MFSRLVSILAICIAASPVMADALYICEVRGDGAWRVTLREAAPEEATAVFVLSFDTGAQSGSYALASSVSGSGFRYEGEGLTFVGKGDEARLIDGADEMSCGLAAGVPEEAQAVPDTAAGLFEVPGTALGGNLRAGPGRQFLRLGSVREGEAITVIEDTGVVWRDHSWFVIRLRDGETAHLWGGLICATGEEGALPGTYADCG